MLLLIAGIMLVLFMLLFLIIWFLRVYISIHYSYEGEEQLLHISLSLAKIKLLNKALTFDDIEKSPIAKDIDSMLDNSKIDSILKAIRKGIEAVQSILHNTRLHQLNWSTNIGTGDASTTGLVSGVLWSIKGTVIGYFVEKLILMCNPDIQVHPKFQHELFETNLNCMVSIRIGKAIQGIIKLTRIYKTS
ncbi:DUF2953 domain-containing protein [Oceanobacillus sp. Castelsardo]|uniref:DUF2953 domain-containing protein n=1 Tax=Oceanobacillus sp. Castelsardo TaxID=1851204 RepID=UPI0008380D1B|nr:DUF2953 domain-containing protein [Oceanobacillus sp. Castelsardo]